MVDRRVTKKKPSPLAALGNVFLAIVLAVSLMPSYSAFGDSENASDAQTEELTDVQQAEDAVDTQVDQQESVQAEESVDVQADSSETYLDQVSNQQVQARSYTWYGADAATTVEMGRVTVEGADRNGASRPRLHRSLRRGHQAGGRRPGLRQGRGAVAKVVGRPGAAPGLLRSGCSTAPARRSPSPRARR